jgi:hypothetical protein
MVGSLEAHLLVIGYGRGGKTLSAPQFHRGIQRCTRQHDAEVTGELIHRPCCGLRSGTGEASLSRAVTVPPRSCTSTSMSFFRQ